MATKLFKIGEAASYGKWRITVEKDQVVTEGIDYFTNRVEESQTWALTVEDMKELSRYLEEVSTSYWGDKMFEWVESKLKGNKHA